MVNPEFTDLEIVDNRYPNRDYEVRVSIEEFNCVCPKTGLPDFAEIIINYTPDKHIVELKSLKLYIVKYRNVGIYHEAATNKIMDDFVKACSPRKIEVTGNYSSRGGISTTVVTNWEK
jgi:7-cyano-7-deazaguanine reductase